jgi:hypothetical protein
MTAEERTFVFEDWLADGIKGVRQSLKRKKKRKPSAVRGHLRSAAKEVLLAWRSLLDGAIDALEAEPESKKKATKIKVE